MNIAKNNIFIFLLLISLLLNIIGVFRYIMQKRKTDEHAKKYKRSILFYLAEDRFQFFILYLNIYIIIFVIYFFMIDNNSNYTNDENDISNKITTISSNLKETATELSIIQQQLESRIDYVETLKKEAEIAENVISLSEEQVNAVQSKINQELNASNNKSALMSFLISSLFFVLGLAVQPTINFFNRKKNKAYNQEIENKAYNQEELLILINEVKNVIERNEDKSSK